MWNAGKYRKDRYKPRVLICDHESRMGSILRDYLSSIGFHTDQAEDCYQCIDLAWLNHPDVILLDMDTPSLGGHEVMRQLRKMGINVPVLLFSTGDGVFPIDDESAVLKKPFRPKDIAVILEAILLESKKEKRFIPRRYKVH